MRAAGQIAGYVGFLLVAIGVVLMWLIDWILGAIFTLFVICVMVWYMNTKQKGDRYLRAVARLTGCEFSGGGVGYGRVAGIYRGHDMEITVNSDYNSLRGIAGFALSAMVLESATGAVAGITNFTSIKIKHRGRVDTPYRLDDQIFVDKQVILFLPISQEMTGLPKTSAKSLVKRIDGIIDKTITIEGSDNSGS